MELVWQYIVNHFNDVKNNILDEDEIEVKAYNRETIIAEKYETKSFELYPAFAT